MLSEGDYCMGSLVPVVVVNYSDSVYVCDGLERWGWSDDVCCVVTQEMIDDVSIVGVVSVLEMRMSNVG